MWRLLGLFCCLVLPDLALAQPAWPNRPISLIVPYPPGGSTDNVARPLVQEWGKVLGQTVVAENRGAKGGTIGADLVARARPGGHTRICPHSLKWLRHSAGVSAKIVASYSA